MMDFIAMGAVAAALGYAGWKIWVMLKTGKTSDCSCSQASSSCSGCPLASTGISYHNVRASHRKDTNMSDDPFIVPLGREFDLHTFRPQEVKSAVEEYLLEARRLGYQQVRIIHGKGIGFQRDVVRKLLAATDFVIEFGDDVNGNRGATWATLKP